MKEISEGLAAHLAAGATTLARCWRLTRRDGVAMGFTDHDRALAFDGVTYEATAGLTASEAQAGLGLSVDNMDVAGALSSAHIREADLLAGLYDGAEVRMFLVNWDDPEERVLMFTGHVGEVSREGGAFVAELRGLAERLSETRGRLYSHTCDAELGDDRCGVYLDKPAFRGAGAVTEVADDRSFAADGLGGFAAGWFAGGRIEWTSGGNQGRGSVVKGHRLESGSARFALRDTPPAMPQAGDQFVVRAGCDKRFETCRNRFANLENFRGFPHMPGNDFVLSYPGRGDGRNRGRSLFA